MTQPSLERQLSEKGGGREEGGLQQMTCTLTDVLTRNHKKHKDIRRPERGIRELTE